MTIHFWNWNIVRSILPKLRGKNWTVVQWSKVFFSHKSTFCVLFENQGLEEEWRGTKSKLLEIQCEVSEVSNDLRCCDICCCWSNVLYQVQSQCSRLPGDFGELYASNCWQALLRCWFLLRRWFSNMADLNPIWNIWYIFKRKLRNSGSKKTDELTAQ